MRSEALVDSPLYDIVIVSTGLTGPIHSLWKCFQHGAVVDGVADWRAVVGFVYKWEEAFDIATYHVADLNQRSRWQNLDALVPE